MFARTKRLLLRPGWKEDAADVTAAITHEDVLKHLPRAPHPYTEADARAFLDGAQNTRSPHFLAFARTSGAPRLVGGCGLQHLDDGRLELGYWIARPFWGLGFATEAARAVMSIARSTALGPVFAAHGADNLASAHVLRKLGFRTTGQTARRFVAARGEAVECVLFEDGAETVLRDDPAAVIYPDRMAVAA